MITKAVIAILTQNLAVKALVGTRIRPNVLKKDETYPAICVNTYRMQDVNCDNSYGVKNGVIEVWVFANDYSKCAQIMAAIKEALNGYSGLISDVGITILRGEQTPDDYDESKDLHIQVIEYEAFAKTSTN